MILNSTGMARMSLPVRMISKESLETRSSSGDSALSRLPRFDSTFDRGPRAKRPGTPRSPYSPSATVESPVRAN